MRDDALELSTLSIVLPPSRIAQKRRLAYNDSIGNFIEFVEYDHASILDTPFDSVFRLRGLLAKKRASLFAMTEERFPDPVFRMFVAEQWGRAIAEQGWGVVTELRVPRSFLRFESWGHVAPGVVQPIRSLEGIEYLANLEALDYCDQLLEREPDLSFNRRLKKVTTEGFGDRPLPRDCFHIAGDVPELWQTLEQWFEIAPFDADESVSLEAEASVAYELGFASEMDGRLGEEGRAKALHDSLLNAAAEDESLQLSVYLHMLHTLSYLRDNAFVAA